MKKEFDYFVEGLITYNNEYYWLKTVDNTVHFRVLPAEETTISYAFWEGATKDIKQILPNAFIFIEEIHQREQLFQQTYYVCVLHEEDMSTTCLSVMTVVGGNAQINWEVNEHEVDRHIRTQFRETKISASVRHSLIEVLYDHMEELHAFRLLFVTGSVR